jgi:restriction system protein
VSKEGKLRELGRKRWLTRWPGYKTIGDYHGGIDECALASPYTKTACNVNAEIRVLLQDWSSDDRLSGPVDEDART